MATTEIYTNILTVGTAVVRSHRQILAAAGISDPAHSVQDIRVKIEAPAGADTIITNASIGERSGSTEDYVAGEFERITWDTGNNGTTVSAGTTKWSDWVSYDHFDHSTDMLFHFDSDTGSNTKYASGGTTYLKNGVLTDAMVQNISGYTPGSFEFGLVSVEVRTFNTDVSVGNTTLIYTGQGVTVQQYPREKKYEVADIVQPTHGDGSHIPCGHWHEGQSDDPIWDFDAQEDLPYPYHEDETYPKVCGHWHKHTGEAQIPCLEYDEEDDWVGTNNFFRTQAPGEMLIYDTDTDMMYGCYDTAGTIFRYDSATMTEERSTTFADIDVDAIYQIHKVGNTIYALITRDTYEGKWIQKITIPALAGSDPFVLDGDPLYCGSVTTGTDAKIYGCLKNLNQSGSYAAQYKPITGGSWADYWEELPGAYSYTIDVYSDYAARSPQVTVGSNIVSFAVHENDAIGTNYVLASGPESVWLQYVAVAHQIEPDGTHYRTFNMGLDIGPWQGAIEPSGNRMACLSHETITGQLTLYIFGLQDGSVSRTVVTGLEDGDGVSRDNTIYHAQCVWGPNGYIYHLHGLHGDSAGRIVAISPGSAAVAHQYWLGTPWNEDHNGFTIMGDYLYAWTDSAAEEGYSTAIMKFTLTLEHVCTYQCPGLGSAETPGSITNDGSTELYNFGVQNPGTKLGIVNYTVPEDPPPIPEPHSPVWDFQKQVDKF
jgi:hypothetical protein